MVFKDIYTAVFNKFSICFLAGAITASTLLPNALYHKKAPVVTDQSSGISYIVNSQKAYVTDNQGNPQIYNYSTKSIESMPAAIIEKKEEDSSGLIGLLK